MLLEVTCAFAAVDSLVWMQSDDDGFNGHKKDLILCEEKTTRDGWARTMGKDARKDECMSGVRSADRRWVSRGNEP